MVCESFALHLHKTAKVLQPHLIFNLTKYFRTLVNFISSVQVGGQMGGDNFACGKCFQKLYGGRKFFLLNTGGKISFSITFPRQVFKVFHVEIFLGGGKKENVPKNSKGGWKKWLWTGVQMGRENILEIF